MGIISWILLGLVAGALGKLLMPGPDPQGWIVTILIGIVGAFIGGIIGTFLGIGDVTGFDLYSILLASGGAFIFLFLLRRFRG